MPLPIGTISMSQVNVELGLPAATNISLNQASVRTLAGKASGIISMKDLQGKANQFAFSIASNVDNLNLRAAAVGAGWDQSAKVVATINAGVTVGSASTGTAAMIVSGAFPNGVELQNNGIIVGMGGGGGTGGSVARNLQNPPVLTNGTVGGSGGTALSVSVPISITNNGTVAGGGGGGGGGGAGGVGGKSPAMASGGGGGGGRSSLTNSASGPSGNSDGVGSYGRRGSAGSVGTFSSAGSGGAGTTSPVNASVRSGPGGGGGGWGSSGVAGTGGLGIGSNGPGMSGGGAGPATSGNSNITWVATGTRLGPLN